jgi:hypothetical protein
MEVQLSLIEDEAPEGKTLRVIRKEIQAVPTTQDEIRRICYEIGEFLADKNEQYGDSALNPVRIFSKAPADEQIRVRIDDKISRLVRGDDRIESDDEIVDDLIGYLIMYKLTKQRQNANS